MYSLDFGLARATSWVKLGPDEVINRAEVVVLGRYAGNGTERLVAGMWVPFKFQVEKYYRASGPEIIQTAIDQFDVQGALRHQEKGGKFLLFLTSEPKENILLPIAGPNGMILVLNGVVQNQTPAGAAAYQEFLANQAWALPDKTSQASISGTFRDIIWYSVGPSRC